MQPFHEVVAHVESLFKADLHEPTPKRLKREETTAPLRLRGGGDEDECDDEKEEKSQQNLSKKRHRKQKGKRKSTKNGESSKKAETLCYEGYSGEKEESSSSGSEDLCGSEGNRRRNYDTRCEEAIDGTAECDDNGNEDVCRNEENPRLCYGSYGYYLSQMLDGELQGDVIQEEEPRDMELSLPSVAVCEVANVIDTGTEDASDGMAKTEDDNSDDKLGAKYLLELDPDFMCSTRLVMRGVYKSEVLKLVVKRRLEGNLVHWELFDTRRNKQIMCVKCQMEYPYDLSLEARGTSNGVKFLGGWGWRGWGYGYINIFPPHDPRVLHVDVEEAIFYTEDVYHLYHVSGRGCKNLEKAEGVVCKEQGCGLRIWSAQFTTFSITDGGPNFHQIGNVTFPRECNPTKEKAETNVFLSLVRFFGGDFKVALHRGPRLKKYDEEVAWMTKDHRAYFDPSVAAVDWSKIQKAWKIWQTRVPTPVEAVASSYSAKVGF